MTERTGPLAGPHHAALLGRHQRAEPQRLAPKRAEIGCRIAEPHDHQPVGAPPVLANALADEAPHHAPERGGVEGAEIDDIQRHGGFQSGM